MFAGCRNDLVQHVVHSSLLMPFVAAIPALTVLKSSPVRIAGMLLVPGCLGVLAEAKRVAVSAVVSVELNSEDIEEEFVYFIPAKELIDHLQHILPVWRVE